MDWHCRQWRRLLIFATTIAVTVMGGVLPANADTLAAPTDVSNQIVQIANQERSSTGLGSLTVDARLAAVAQERAQFLISHGYFSHCADGAQDSSCSQSGMAIVPDLAQAGIAVNDHGTVVAENLAMNNFLAAPGITANAAAMETETAWLDSPDHRANIMDPKASYTGVSVACCWVGTYNGTVLLPSDHASVYVQLFSGGPGAVPATASSAPAGTFTFVLGFATLAGAIPQVVGQPTDDESHNPVNGDALQHTTGGLLVWRKADNWTAFTDGFHTWVNGPSGVRKRLNTQRFSFEANPDGLPLAP
jgi:hypothetical protein